MSKVAHTPGPWSDVWHSWAEAGIQAGSIPIASLRIDDRHDEETQDHYEAVMTANARLIASCPELLAALEQCLSCLADACDFDTAVLEDREEFKAHLDKCQQDVGDAIAAARAALAKARGETP